jgi:hypothetical protein
MKRRNRPLVFAVVLLVLAGGGYGFMVLRESMQEQKRVDQLFGDAERLLADGDRRSAELSRVVARLEDLDVNDRRVAMLLARIDVLRERYQRAIDRMDIHLMGATNAVEDRTAALAYLNQPLRGGADELERRSAWRRSREHAERAHAQSGEAGDLFLAWQAASRAEDDDNQKRVADQLEREHGSSLEARTVALLLSEDVQIESVDDLANEWDVVPIELELARGALLLLGQDYGAAAGRLQELLSRAPNIIKLRHLAAFALHAFAQALPEGAERERQLQLRNAQLQWLSDNAAADDPRRPQWRDLMTR